MTLAGVPDDPVVLVEPVEFVGAIKEASLERRPGTLALLYPQTEK
jgi:hypothetical protein